MERASSLPADEILPEEFFGRPVLEVAVDLLGRFVVAERGSEREVVLRITEVEAYGGEEDTASHCRSGRTARNAPMWGPPGRAYVYLCYGIHRMLNVVTGNEGQGQAVLVRSAEVITGHRVVEERRRGAASAVGPGNVGSALGLDLRHSGAPLFDSGPLEIHRGRPATQMRIGPRVGVDYATARDRDLAWRFVDAESSAITHPKKLRSRPIVIASS